MSRFTSNEPIEKFLPMSSIVGTEKGYSSKDLNISGISEDMSIQFQYQQLGGKTRSKAGDA